jgi:hypothetical protein
MKAWRNHRELVIQHAPADPEDTQRTERLISLLATGLERLLAQQDNKSPESVDFQADLLPNTCTSDETAKRESA